MPMSIRHQAFLERAKQHLTAAARKRLATHPLSREWIEASLWEDRWNECVTRIMFADQYPPVAT